jgi:hypothetical protein
MSRRVRRVRYGPDVKGIVGLSQEAIAAILLCADDLIMSGGQSLLAGALKGSRPKKVRELGFDRNPVCGYYTHLTIDEIVARIHWTIINRCLAIEYEHRLPVLRYTQWGWEIERETFANELLKGFDDMLAAASRPCDMSYLKDRARDMILLLLEKVQATGDTKYLPLSEARAADDYKKVRKKIGQVIRNLKEKSVVI